MGKVKKYEELTIIDDFMFGKVMRNPKRCKRLLELVLGMKIRRIEFLDDQETIHPDYKAKGIRLDVYAEDDEDSVYSVEMQAHNTGALPQRTRYYQGMIDINLLEKGASYKTLRKNYIIFICTFDPFGQGRHIYHFSNRCEEDPALALGDGTKKIFLNTKGTRNDVNEDLKNLLSYFDSHVPTDDFTRELDKAVINAKEHKEWRGEYMKLTLWQQDIMDEAREAGLAEGREAGLAEGCSEGERKQLIKTIVTMHKKSRSVEETADLLEEDVDFVRKIYMLAAEFAPEYDMEAIHKKYKEEEQS